MPVEYTEAMKAFSWPEELRHAPGSPDQEGNGFRSACRCGYKGKLVTSSPSHAYAATRVHAENENRREQQGGAKVDASEYQTGGQPPRSARPVAPSRPVVGSPRASRPSGGTGARPCACGCGETCGGLFRPGHDSKLLSRLVTEHKTKGRTVDECVAEMAGLGCSEKLQDKFKQKVA